MRYSLVKIAALAALSSLAIGTADAAMITGTYTVTGSNFASLPASPYASITESFTISFDTTMSPITTTTGISLNSSTITPTSTLGYQYISFSDTLIVGGIASTVGASDPNSTDFALNIKNASNLSGFSITSLSYSVGTGVSFTAATATGVPAAVPEPATLALLGASAALVALARRRRTES